MAVTAEKFRAYVTDLVFPNRCPFCYKFISWKELCCEKCGCELTYANDIICHSPEEKDIFDRKYGAFFFDEVWSGVYEFKRNGSPNFAEMAAEDIVSHIKADGLPIPDIVVPVPMGRKKKFVRGHNQAEIFAASLAKRLDIPVKCDILFKYDEKDEQHFHNAEERAERVGKLFYGKETDLSGKSVLLCDDVITTGATVNRCALLLKDMGALSVTAAACAVTRLGE